MAAQLRLLLDAEEKQSDRAALLDSLAELDRLKPSVKGIPELASVQKVRTATEEQSDRAALLRSEAELEQLKLREVQEPKTTQSGLKKKNTSRKNLQSLPRHLALHQAPAALHRRRPVLRLLRVICKHSYLPQQ